MPLTRMQTPLRQANRPLSRVAGAFTTAFGIGLFAAGALTGDPLHAQAQQSGIGEQKPPGQVPTAPGDAKPNEPLSDRLSRSQGIVRPPDGIDPGIHAPAPEPNPQTTPVIPPPGTPGSDPNVQPK